MTDPSQPPDPVDLRRASDDGDAEAAHRLAVLAAVGFRMPPDWTLALGQLARAAALGSGTARDQLAVLAPDAGPVAAGRDDAAAWDQAARAVDLASWLAPPRPMMISPGPHVLSIPGFPAPGGPATGSSRGRRNGSGPPRSMTRPRGWGGARAREPTAPAPSTCGLWIWSWFCCASG
ncbi:hypothetical protein [Brevundimonas denitrificans]|uniref:hypothetical protein n=1 Tax=Brevundimonas denitrificans TaxID=1443434 RepID=UPI00223B3495|nr:hypothetical protein [Brevundimonas denitrificans]